MHVIATRRKELHMSITDVARASGIAPGTIRSIERGGRDFKVNERTAEAIAHGLRAKVMTLFRVEELSNLGRPPKTGTELTTSKRRIGTICTHCYLEVPSGSSTCPECTGA